MAANRGEWFDPAADVPDQVVEASADLTLPASAHLKLPFPTLARLVGPISPAEVWFVAAFSGNGKTTFLMSLVLEYIRAGKRIYYMGLESSPRILRRQFACLRLGHDVGLVLSGMGKDFATWPQVVVEIGEDLRRQLREPFWVDSRPEITLDGLPAAFRFAAEQHADLLVIDHIDQIELAGSSNAYEQSLRVTSRILGLAKEYQVRALIATQLNNEIVKGGDRLSAYQPPQAHHVYMGSKKRQIATTMLGLYRPVRKDLSPADRKDIREGFLDAHTALEPNTMGVIVMKHRHFGNREGQRCALHVEQGRVTDQETRP